MKSKIKECFKDAECAFHAISAIILVVFLICIRVYQMWLKKLLDKIQKPYYNSRYNLGEKMASKNYTDEMVSQMVESYQEQPNLETVAN